MKRERYAVKELARLKKTLGVDDNVPKDVEMSDLAEIATGKISCPRYCIDNMEKLFMAIMINVTISYVYVM